MAGADTRQGVRVAASFATGRGEKTGEEATEEQVIVFYTVPADLFHDMSRGAAPHQPPPPPRMGEAEADPRQTRSEPGQGQDEGEEGVSDVLGDWWNRRLGYPVEICGQPVAVCERVSELALESSPEMIIWAFGGPGWARTWAVDSGTLEAYTRSALQRDGSVRRVEEEMEDLADEAEATAAAEEGAGAEAGGAGYSHKDGSEVQPFDGAAGSRSPGGINRTLPGLGYFGRRGRCWRGDGMSGTVSVDLVEEVRGIVRVDVELR